DFHVTGVQTCALPISILAADPPRREKLEGETELEDLLEVALAKGGDEEAAVRLGDHDTVLNQLVQRLADRCAADAELIAEAQVRSEERRVGKEGGYRV